jgi:hypothetical protein
VVAGAVAAATDDMNKKNPDPSPATRPHGSVVNALTAGAMALPGLAAGTVSADGPAEEFTIDADYSHYKEDKIRPRKTIFGGERDRMEIDSYKFRLTAPLTSRSDLNVAGGYESMSGASPWFVLPGPDGRPAQVMSGATIDDERGDMLVTGNYYFDSAKASLSSGFSVENDYWSINLGLGGEYSFNDKNTTISGGTGISFDWIDPTDSQQFDRTSNETKRSYTVYGAISQILTRHSTFQSPLTFGYSEGYLSDPYKRAYVDQLGGSFERDERPDDRMQFTWLNRYRHHVSAVNGTLHLDYRMYADDWSMNSHTFEVAWYQSLPYGFQFIPSFRYYSQSQAEFYEVFYDDFTSDGLYSSDYRLSPYGALSYRFKLSYTAEDVIGHLDVEAAVSYERYESSGGFAFQRVDQENPGLVAFRLYAARLTVRF